ncbi:MAG: hypothetical protein ACREJD_14695 [Phycisphaerales bacterium]
MARTRMAKHTFWNGTVARIAVLACLIATTGHFACAEPEELIVYVDQAAPAGGDGSSWDRAFRDIHDATDLVLDTTLQAPHDLIEIRLAKGVYRPDRGTGNRATAFLFAASGELTRNFHVRGCFRGFGASEPDKQDFEERTILSGDLQNDDLPGFVNRSDNSFLVASAGLYAVSVLFEGIDVRGGYAALGESTSPRGETGGLRLTVSSPVGDPNDSTVLQDCRFEENQTDRTMGAGVTILAPSAQIVYCEFRRNRALRAPGGAVALAVQYGFSTGFYSCVFESNSATHGGAIYQERNRIDVARCVFVGNTAEVEGGAIAGIGGTTAASLFVRNRAGGSGGAIATTGYLGAKIGACTFVSNTAGVGAAINSYSSGLNVTQCLFADNVSSSPAGVDLRCIDTVQPSQFSYNLFSQGLSTIDIEGGTATYSQNLINQNAQFIRPANPTDTDSEWENWNYRLRLNSKGIGIGGQWAGRDLDGRWRNDGNPKPGDAGCYYYSYFTCPANISRDLDQFVDDADFVLFIGAYIEQISPPANPDADLNRDGLVDDADFSLFAATYDRLICP